MAKYNRLNNKDDAVSPAIAVVLIVMLTIVLVSVFAVGMLSMSGAIHSTKIVGVTAEPYSSTTDRGVQMTYWGGKDADQLISIQAVVGDYKLLLKGTESDTVYPVVGGKYDFSVSVGKKTIIVDGHEVTTTENLDEYTIENADVNFVGTFTDGTKQVLYISKMTIPGTEEGTFNNGVINVSGYSYSGTYAGHGVLITPYDDVTIKTKVAETIGSYSFIDESGNEYTSGLFSSIEKTPDNIYLVVINPDNPLPYNNKNRNGELVGWVEVIAKTKDGTQKYHVENIVIPPRINVINGPEYSGKIVSSAKIRNPSEKDTMTSVNVSVSEGVQLTTTGSSVISYLKKADGTVSLLRNTLKISKDKDIAEYHSAEGHSYGLGYVLSDTTKFSDDDIVEIYFSTPQKGNSYVWRLVVSTTVGDIRKMWT